MDQSIDRSVSKGIEKMDSAGRDAKNTINEGAVKTRDSARNVSVPTVVTQQFRALKEQSQAALDRTEEMVKEHPFYAVFGAAAVGAIVGGIVGNALTSRFYKH